MIKVLNKIIDFWVTIRLISILKQTCKWRKDNWITWVWFQRKENKKRIEGKNDMRKTSVWVVSVLFDGWSTIRWQVNRANNGCNHKLRRCSRLLKWAHSHPSSEQCRSARGESLLPAQMSCRTLLHESLVIHSIHILYTEDYVPGGAD